MDNLAWSNGIKPNRSHKQDHPSLRKSVSTTSDSTKQPLEQLENMEKEVQPISGDYILHNTIYDFSNSRREECNSKLHDRYLVSRACSNPFLTHLNYVDDITTQEKFLMPRNSNMEDK